MTLTIFITQKEFNCLSRNIPIGSHSKKILAHPVQLASKFISGNYVLSCEEPEARNLLMYARDRCPGAAAQIIEAFKAAGLAPE